MAEKKRKSFLFKFFIAILTLVVIFAIILGTGYFYVKTTYGIDIIQTYKQLKSLNAMVDESKFTNRFADTDMASIRGVINDAFGGTEVITYSDTDGYAVADIDSLQSISLNNNIELDSKECGALLNILINDKDITTVSFGDMNAEFSLIQIGISEATSTNTINFNSVVKIEMTEIKSKFTAFPLSLLNNLIPNSLYVSANVQITKGTEPFSYTITNGSVIINNLSQEETNSLLTTLDKVAGIGTVTELSGMICEPFVNALIGNSTNNGFAYSLSPLAQDFSFNTISNVFKFVVEKA